MNPEDHDRPRIPPISTCRNRVRWNLTGRRGLRPPKMNEPAAGKPVFLLLLLIRVYYLLFFLFHILLPPPRFRSRSVIIHFLWELTRKVLEPTDFFFFGVDDALDKKNFSNCPYQWQSVTSRRHKNLTVKKLSSERVAFPLPLRQQWSGMRFNGGLSSSPSTLTQLQFQAISSANQMPIIRVGLRKWEKQRRRK